MTAYLSKKVLLPAVIAFITMLMPVSVGAVRIKDIADLKGVRNNQLVGYGLVVGLDGTGDGKKSRFTVQSMVSMLEKMGITVNSGDVAVSNVAAVMVTGDLPAFSRAGSRIDAMVSSIGDAKNLQGGTLLLTPLRAVNGQVFAVAQGPVNTGGFSAAGAGGNGSKKFSHRGACDQRCVGRAGIGNGFQQPGFVDPQPASTGFHNGHPGL